MSAIVLISVISRKSSGRDSCCQRKPFTGFEHEFKNQEYIYLKKIHSVKCVIKSLLI